MANALREYVERHTKTREPAHPTRESEGWLHFGFFEAAMEGTPAVADLRRLLAEHLGEWATVDPFDGREHNFIELGAWIGDQGAAMRLIALGDRLGLWQGLTPVRLLGKWAPEPMLRRMEAGGMIGLIAKKQEATVTNG